MKGKEINGQIIKNLAFNGDVVIGNSLIDMYAKWKQSMNLFEKMRVFGIKPNSVTFTTVLASCSHSGLVDDGWRIFESMRSNYRVEPMVGHYACMVDFLGHLGYLKEALELIDKMPEQRAPSVWGALLGACRMHNNVDMGEIAAYRLFELEPKNPINYVALCGIYDSVDRLDGVLRIRSRMRELRKASVA
ncbi:pentatricopeptide repeat-containing protein At3g46790, chloroplastic-like [Telopea speciosissima]|uniref:pentatricopeptide repeat-containing protein At3g46790, chloroplastic-like n=1 Tax=Telopea speciosissima TaxID=54955 RepID=UPI001CC4DF9B|nr:pentatricopeptide repeat-containing protein At3g46790, chloroplastic-like [Telopea speciosissima]